MARLEQAKALEAKMKSSKKRDSSAKAGGKTAGLKEMKPALTPHGLGGAEVAVPNIAALMDGPKKHRKDEVYLRSKDLSTKRPSSEKLYAAFEAKMQQLKMPVRLGGHACPAARRGGTEGGGPSSPLPQVRPIPTEANVELYNKCRAHVVLLVELEAKNEKMEAELRARAERKAGGGGGSGSGGGSSSHHSSSHHAQPRVQGGGGGSHKRSHGGDHHGGSHSHKRSHH
jgi:hypothetical protein